MELGIIVRLFESDFGFIARIGDERDLFFHSNELTDVFFEDLREGDVLEFEVAERIEGPIAIKV